MGVGLAWGFEPEEIFLGVFAKKTDPMSGGRQLPGHWSSPELRVLSQSSVIGTQYLHAVGIAHGVKIRGEDSVVVVYGGEGSTSEGDWHEAMNWAGIHKLPLIFMIENNGYAISVPEEEEIAGSLAARAEGYGFPGVEVDGNRTLRVYRAMKEAVARARAGEGPTLIEAETYRYYAHTSDDNDTLYRSREEVETWRKRDPVARIRQYLIEKRLLSEADEAAIGEEVVQILAKAVERAESAPDPDEPTTRVYARVIEPGPGATEPEPDVSGESVNLITAINRALHEVMEALDDTVVFGEDVARRKGGVFKATQDLTDRFRRTVVSTPRSPSPRSSAQPSGCPQPASR